MIEVWDGEADLLPLATSWMNEAVPGEYNVYKGMKTIREMHEDEFSDILVWKDFLGKVVGFMGIQVHDVFFTDRPYAAVRGWYVLPGHRWHARAFIKGAMRWAARHGCESLLVCSSKLCPNSDKFLKKMKFNHFETVYAGDV